MKDEYGFSRIYNINELSDRKKLDHYSNLIKWIAKLTNCKRYLEIGVNTGENIYDIRYNVDICEGVDVNDNILDKDNIIFNHMSSDEFFQKNTNIYDIIFIDGDHSFDQVKIDFENSLKVLNKYGIIILHDTDPMEQFLTNSIYCKDAYKIVDYIYEHHSELNIITFPIHETGLSFVMRKEDRRMHNFVENFSKEETKEENKVIDAFIFYNELEMLMFRLKELNDYVDYFVLVESRQTHSGKDKELYFENNKDLFKEYLHKIIHIVDDYLPDTESISGFKYTDEASKNLMYNFKNTPARIREEYQRNSITKGLDLLNLKDDDIVIISDIDEIINPNIILKYKNQNFDMLALEQDLYFYNLNYKYPKIWTFPKVVKYKMLKELTPEDIRLSTKGEKVSNGGWHFSYFFGAQNIADKIKNFSHQEFNNDLYTNERYIEYCIKNGKDIFGDIKLKYIDIGDNDSLPKNYKILLDWQKIEFDISYDRIYNKLNISTTKKLEAIVSILDNNKNLIYSTMSYFDNNSIWYIATANLYDINNIIIKIRDLNQNLIYEKYMRLQNQN